MFRRLLALTATVVAVGVVATGAAADSTFSDRLVYDCGPMGGDCFTSRDMVGFDVGWVTSYQRQNGDLYLNIAVRGGDPSTSYGVRLWCGPTHATAGNVAAFTTAATSPAGRETLSFVVTAAQLAAACGTGSHTSHVDLDSGLPSTITATGITWSLP